MIKSLLNMHPLAQLGSAGTSLEPAPMPTELAPSGGNWLLLPSVTNNSASVDVPFYFILWFSLVIFVLLVLLLAWCFIRNRRSTPNEMTSDTLTESHSLQWIAGGIAIVVMVDIFYLGLRGYVDLATVPVGALPISVEAKQWSWSFAYPNGHVDSVLHVPINRPIELRLKSADINHSFFVPAFRLQAGVLPEQSTTAWFESNQPGEYVAVNSAFSGQEHANMWAKIVVHEPEGYERWLNEVTDPFRSHIASGRRVVVHQAGLHHLSFDRWFAQSGPQPQGPSGETGSAGRRDDRRGR